MAKGKKTGGRTKGTPNKRTGCEQEFRDAWAQLGGPKVAHKLIEQAVSKAMGYEVTETTKNKAGEIIKTKIWHEFNFGPLAVILPFIAQKMAQDVAVTGGDGEAITITFAKHDA